MELRNRYVQLVPITREHAAEFVGIGSDPEAWHYLAGEPFRDVTDAQNWIDSMISRGGGNVTYSVFDRQSGKLTGSTSYLDVSPTNGSLEIGYTWYGTQFQRTHINTATKRLLLAYAFETLGASRVQLKTDLRNEASQRAIGRIGGVKEGVLRKHKRYPNGFIRDTVVYSILNTEWPSVRDNLDKILNSHSTLDDPK